MVSDLNLMQNGVRFLERRQRKKYREIVIMFKLDMNKKKSCKLFILIIKYSNVILVILFF